MKDGYKDGITVLSLFDGMSCGQLALQKLGIKVKAYYASEIDKPAIRVAMKNFPNTIQLGDVTKVFAKDLPKIDLLIGGSPCQGFSFAGKQLAFDDPRSKLFFEFIRLKEECQPTYFMLENVKMKKEFEFVISKYMGIEPIEINSALVSAQNRVRLYWTNIGAYPYGIFDQLVCQIPQPKDKGVLLRDILEEDVPDKYYLTDKLNKWLERHSSKRGTRIKRLDGNQKASCITSTEAKCNLENDYIIVASRGRNQDNPSDRANGIELEQTLDPRFDGKTNCITSVQKDNLVMQINPHRKITRLNDTSEFVSQQDRVYSPNGVSPALLADMGCGSHAILDNELNLRRLTPTECERLQTVPDGYTDCVSDTQRYRMLGNGWTIDVIAHILSYLP